jgi:acyl-CoA thioester hydrolase
MNNTVVQTSECHEFIWPVRIYYEDTDVGGVVYYANYLKFMERARTEWLRQLGIDQTQLKQQEKLIFVVRQLTINYLKPALFDDLLQVTISLTQLGKVSLTITQKISRQTVVLCTATSKIACVDALNLRPQPFPPNLLKEFLTVKN